MRYTGTIWRPPYEAGSLLLEVTAGCTHHSCKFCTLYDELPFRFRVTPMETVEADLAEAQMLFHTPLGKLQDGLLGVPRRKISRIFLVGANPFVLHFNKLEAIAAAIRKYFPECETIGCFSRVTDITLKTPEQLQKLRALGYDGLTIGVETGDDNALAFMRKGYPAREIIEQSKRLDDAGISYNFFYLAGLSGNGLGTEGAAISASVFNQTHPKRIGSSMLTIFPESELYQEIQRGNWTEESEIEKLEEVMTLVQHLEIPVEFAMLGASNAVSVQGRLPDEKARMLSELKRYCAPQNEAALRQYRVNLPHL